MKHAAVIPAKGIGDALLMMIASHQLFRAGYEVTTFHPALKEMQNWFPDHHFASFDTFDRKKYDCVILENDNSLKIEGASVFYPTYSPAKHGPLSPSDHVFDPSKPMAENIAKATATLLKNESISKDNGIIIPSHLVHRKYKKRIVIHRTSSQIQKNWTPRKFEKLAEKLKRLGWDPIFADKDKFQTLADLASFIYESRFMIGNDSLIGHLASNLSIPTLILSDDPKRMQLWRPGWLEGEVLTAPPYKFAKRHWQHFITISSVLSSFNELVCSH